MGTVEIRRGGSEETSGEKSRKRLQTISLKNQLKGKKVGQKNEGRSWSCFKRSSDHPAH
jgi:hypothetical protein